MGKKIADIPYMLKMWDEKLNKDAPEDVSVHLEEVRYWRCPDCGYSWQSSVKARYRSSGKCPCHESNKAIMKGVNDALTVVKGLRELLDEDNDLDALSTQGTDSSMPINLYCRECGRKWTVDLHSQVKRLGKGEYKAAGCPHYNTVKRKKEDVPLCIEVESLARFWDPANLMDPSKTRSNSTKKAHFICRNCGYDWTAEIRGQTRGTGKCKCCELHLVTRKGHTDLFTLIPESKDYYDFELNKDIDIYSLPIRNDDVEINWKCPDCGYRWKSTLASRISGKNGSYHFHSCKRCSTTKIKPVSSSRKLIKYWDSEKNKSLNTDLISVNSYDKAHWKCEDCGYEWSVTIKWMNSNDGACPACAGRKYLVIKGKNDVLTLCPEIASIYDFEKNEGSGIDIYRLSPNSKTEAFFKCQKCGNEWKSPVSNRVRAKDGGFGLVDCPVCSNKSFRKIPYSVQYPDMAAMYMDDMNIVPLDGIVGANGLFKSYYYWKCPNCNEVFSSTLNSMIQSYNYSTKGCPYCSHTKLGKGMSFGDIHPELVREYSKDNTTDIYNVFPSSDKTVKWECPDCGTEWETSLLLRHMGHGKCPSCYKYGRNLNTESFASRYPELVKLWSPNNERTPYNTFYTSNYWVHWICPDCGGEYGADVDDMVNGNAECPYCKGNLVLEGFNSLADKNPELAKRISPLSQRTAGQILPSTTTLQLWRCPDCGGDFNATTYNMENGYTCPYCDDRMLLEGFNSLAEKKPELAKLISPLNDLPAHKILPSQSSRQLWRCHDCGGDYGASISEMENGYTCPYCDGRRFLEGYNSLDVKKPELAKLLSPLNELAADKILPVGSARHLWRCPDCGGDYTASISDMENGYICPYCDDRRLLEGYNSLAERNPELAKLVSPLNELTADKILPVDSARHLWRCPDCGGDYTASISDMENGYICPYCDDRRLLKGFNSFGDKHPELLSELYELGNGALGISPFDLLCNSEIKLWWVCPNDKSHKYKMSPNTRLMFQKRSKQPCLYCRGHRRNPNYFMDYNASKKQNQESEQ